MKSVGTILALSEDLHTKNQAPCLQFANNRESVTCGLEIFQKCCDIHMQPTTKFQLKAAQKLLKRKCKISQIHSE